MHNGSLGKPENARKTPAEADRLEAPAKNQGRLVDPGQLRVEERTRDSAMFNLAIHSKLRSCDGVRLKVEDVARMA
jgi:hypothetical protein